jgi:hypothetical protein
MRTTLLVCLVSISFGVIALTLTIVHNILQKQVRREISANLERSISTLRNIQSQRLQMLSREVSLLAALPVLKSLMTTSDERTIRDGAADFYELSGGDLFALADGNGKPVALYEGGAPRDPASLAQSVIPEIRGALQPNYVMVRGNLFEVAVQPLYFGAAASGTRLGYVILGYSVDRELAEQVSQATSAEVIFYADKTMVATTLDDRYRAESAKRSDDLLSFGAQEADTWFGGEHFVHAAVLLSGTAQPRVQLVVLKSCSAARWRCIFPPPSPARSIAWWQEHAPWVEATSTTSCSAPGPAKFASWAMLSIACAAACVRLARNWSQPSGSLPSDRWRAPFPTTCATTCLPSMRMPSFSAMTPLGRTSAWNYSPKFAKASAA